MGLLSKLQRQYWLMAALGAVVIGITMPTILVIWHTQFFKHTPDWTEHAGGPSMSDRISMCLGVEIGATLFCGPIAMILALILYTWLPRHDNEVRAAGMMRSGLIRGAVIAFFNIPGYYVIIFMNPRTPFEWLRVALLFLVAGATSGLWIGWQAYRSKDSVAKFFPQISLGGLLALVIAWSVLLAIFRP